MIEAFSTALGTALTGFVTEVETALGSNLTKVLPIVLGIIGIFLLWRVVKKFAGGR